jgi:hypothetical protein
MENIKKPRGVLVLRMDSTLDEIFIGNFNSSKIVHIYPFYFFLKEVPARSFAAPPKKDQKDGERKVFTSPPKAKPVCINIETVNFRENYLKSIREDFEVAEYDLKHLNELIGFVYSSDHYPDYEIGVIDRNSKPMFSVKFGPGLPGQGVRIISVTRFSNQLTDAIQEKGVKQFVKLDVEDNRKHSEDIENYLVKGLIKV